MSSIQSRFLTLLFLDVPNVIQVREEKGIEGQRAFQQRCLSIVNLVRKQHGGAVVRSVGSTVLCAFERPEDAVRAACVLQETAHGSTASEGVLVPIFRIGLHAGVVILRNGGCVGDAVTASSRIVSMAKNSQILATHEVYIKLPTSLQRQFMELPTQPPSKHQLNIRLYEVIWRSDGKSADPDLRASGVQPMEAKNTRLDEAKAKTATTMLAMEKFGLDMRNPAKAAANNLEGPIPPSSDQVNDQGIKTHTRRTNRKIILKEILPDDQPPPPPPPDPSTPTARLCLLWQQRIIVVEPRRQKVTMGRESNSDIVISVTTASREHAEVTCRGTDFYLTDHSSNGTFLYDEEGIERLIHRDEIKLNGSGVICPGCPGSEEGSEAIRFIQAT